MVLIELWDRLATTQPALGWPHSVALAVVAWVGIWTPLGRRWSGRLTTVLHEAGHAGVARLMGRQVSAMRLHADVSGVTVSRGRPRGLGMIATVFAGYPMPAVAGILAAVLLRAGYGAAFLWGVVVLCFLLGWWMRNLMGWWILAVIAVSAALVSWFGSPLVITGVGYLVAWTLLFSAPRAVWGLQRGRRERHHASDADQLARLTHLPGVVWVAAFWLIGCGALLVGGWLLLLLPNPFA